MATITNKPDTYSFLGNLKKLIINSTEAITLVLSKGADNILTVVYEPSNSVIEIDLSKVISDYLSDVFPVSDRLQTVTPDAFTFKVDALAAETFYVLKGGVDAEITSAWFTSNFLTWQPQTNYVQYNQPGWLSYFALQACSVKCTGHFSDNTTQVVKLSDCTQNVVNVVNVQYSSLLPLFSDKQPQYLDIYVEDAAGNRLSYVQRLVLRGAVNYDDYFIFRNSLGGWDCITFTGIRKPVGDFEPKTAVKEDVTAEYAITTKKKYSKNTGYISTKDFAVWVREFFSSSQKYWVDDSGNAVCITAEKASLTEVKEDVCSCDFTYSVSKDTDYRNLTRAALPDQPLQLIDPSGQLFFLAPRLSDFTTAVLSDNVLIPLQTGTSVEWKQTTLGALKQYFGATGGGGTVICDDTLNENSVNAIQNKAVAKEFSKVSKIYGAAIKLNEIGEGASKVYSIDLLDASGNKLSTTDQFSGGGGGSGATKIVLTRLSADPIVKEGDEVKLSYKYEHIDSSTQQSTGMSGTATVTITHGITVNTFSELVLAGATKSIDASKYIGLGVSTVRVKMVVGEGDEQQVSTVAWTVQVIQLTLTSSYNLATAIMKGDRVSIPYVLTGAGDKTLRCYVDGADKEDKSISASTANGSFDVDTSGMSHGLHTVQLVAEVNDTTIKSQSIYLGIAVRETGNDAPIAIMRIDSADGTIFSAGATPYLQTKQYATYDIVFAVFNPAASPAHADIYVNGVIVSSKDVAFITTTVTLRAMDYGTAACKITCGATVLAFNNVVSKSDLSISEPTDNLIFKLSALGRSNSDSNKTEWKYGDITSTLSGFKFGGDGWLNNALRHTDAARTTINYRPLALPAQNANSAFAFVMKYKVSDVRDTETVVAQCVDAAGTGFIVTASEARMVTKGNSVVTMKMAPGELYEIAFVSFPQSKTSGSSDYEVLNSAMVYLYINGIMSGAVQRLVNDDGTASGDTIYQDNPVYITLGSDAATLDAYVLRAFSSYLTDAQVLDCFIVDKDTSDEIVAEYENNAVLDADGNITVDSVPDNMRYIIITGKQANDVATVLQAAVVNAKSTKYDVDEILCVKRSNPELNFRLLGGCISLQGTSSLAYPIKNYRFYTNNAKKVAGQLYLGCDEKGIGGTLQAKPLYSFHAATASQKAAAPVKCFCLKADYAESSSSHNTGMARLVQNTMLSVGELTPPQSKVSSSYLYDVRTTVDGEPCMLFYRKTLQDTPVLLGKFNFNNDKSTESVFGFKDIPGYHDQAWINEKFAGSNPTECWEFLNNDYKMGMFLDDDFDATEPVAASDGTIKQVPKWLKVFEARFPDDDTINAAYEAGTKKPAYLEALVKWVKSTDTTAAGLTADEIAARKLKFTNELGNYFAVDYLCDYYVFTDIFGCVDQRVKNQMMAFWYDTDSQKMLAYMIFYDCDTIMGVRNDGRLKYSWDIDEESTDPELTTADKTVYAYAGHDSVLWKNLRECMSSGIAAAYKRLRAKLSLDTILEMFDTEQSAKFCERIYNYDALAKYVKPKTIGVDVVVDSVTTKKQYSYLESMQGSRQAHRHWWLSNRLNLFDARFSTGQYTLTDLSWKGNSAAGATVSAVLARKFYLEVRREGETLLHSGIDKGATFTYTYAEIANVGTIFHLLGGEWIKSLDLSGWGGFTDISLPELAHLETLILGKAGSTSPLTEIAISTKLPMLRTIDLQGYTALPTLNLGGCKRIESVNASGCAALSSIAIAEGAPLTSLVLPDNYKILVLRSLAQITRAGITFANIANITELWVENCAQLSGVALFNEIITTTGTQLKYVRITGLNLSGTGADLQRWMAAGMGGVNEEGVQVAHPKLIGTYQLTSYMQDDTLATLQEYFDELNIKQAPYSTIEFDDSVADPANISNLDNSTGYKFGNVYAVSGHIAKILSLRHRVLGKKTADGEVTICQLHDKNSNYYADNDKVAKATPAVLTGAEGDIFVYEPHYWYKGVNDFFNNKHYAHYSSNDECPPAALCVKKSIDDLEVTVNTAVKIAADLATAAAATESVSRYKLIKVSVDGYKQVRFPFLASTTYGAVMTDAAGNILRRLSLSSDSGIVSGYYVFTAINSSEKYLYFTVESTAPFDYVLLSKSSEIEAIEPDWVEHTEDLGGVCECKILDGKPRSIAGQTSTDKTSPDDYDTAMATRGTGYQRQDYENRKDVANLFFAAYGTRDSQSVCGYAFWSMAVETGKTMECGMRNTIPDDNSSHNNVHYINDDGITVSDIELINCLGYEALWANAEELVNAYCTNRVMHTLSYNKQDRKLIIPAGLSDSYLSKVMHGRYMDIMPISVKGSSSTYYCDMVYQETETYPTQLMYLFAAELGYGVAAVDKGITFMGFMTWMNSTSDYNNNNNRWVCRLAFRGNIKKVSSPSVFKAIVEI